MPGGYEEWPLLDEYLHHMEASTADMVRRAKNAGLEVIEVAARGDGTSHGDVS